MEVHKLFSIYSRYSIGMRYCLLSVYLVKTNTGAITILNNRSIKRVSIRARVFRLERTFAHFV